MLFLNENCPRPWCGGRLYWDTFRSEIHCLLCDREPELEEGKQQYGQVKRSNGYYLYNRQGKIFVRASSR